MKTLFIVAVAAGAAALILNVPVTKVTEAVFSAATAVDAKITEQLRRDDSEPALSRLLTDDVAPTGRAEWDRAVLAVRRDATRVRAGLRPVTELPRTSAEVTPVTPVAPDSPALVAAINHAIDARPGMRDYITEQQAVWAALNRR